jgi:cytidylate kinase
MIITIDGPVSSGKSTIAKQLAKELDFFYLCSGLLYRVYAFVLNEKQINLNNYENVIKSLKEVSFEYKNDENKNPEIIYNKINIKSYLEKEEVGSLASIISPYKELREVVTQIQRSFAINNKLMIIDGRDCGTKVFPNANFKFYLTASLDARIDRVCCRTKENNKNYKDIIKERDNRDSKRLLAPSVPAYDSYLIDTSCMSVERTLSYIKNIIKII